MPIGCFSSCMSRCNFYGKRGIDEVMHTLPKTFTLVAAVMSASYVSKLVRADEAKFQTPPKAQSAKQLQTQTEPNRDTQSEVQAKTMQNQAKSEKPQAQVRGTTTPDAYEPMQKQVVTKSEQRLMRYPYQWVSNYLYRQYLDDLASERRERLRTRSEELRENLDRYTSTSRWWYTPWLEANRQWLDASQDYLRDLADLRREQILAESDYRRKMFHPLTNPGPAAWHPYGMGPWKPSLAPWGPYP